MTKKDKDILKNEEGTLPCRYCLKKHKKIVYPRVVEVDDLYYAQCPECTHYDKYEFLGYSRKSTLKNWNVMMEGRNFIH